MLEPTTRRVVPPPTSAYPPRERWVLDARAYAKELSGESRLQHQKPTSDEVGMQERACGARAVGCSINKPTSHEVGMQECA